MKRRKPNSAILTDVEAKLHRWQDEHDTPSKVARAHRRVLLQRVVESMAFENEKVSMARLKTLLRTRKGRAVG